MMMVILVDGSTFRVCFLGVKHVQFFMFGSKLDLYLHNFGGF
uniref:Tetraspanin-8-like n=1 Tax=Rhizophora mucronata TaxID=61149 RepID=A0A2P2Q1H4_RHIMU